MPMLYKVVAPMGNYTDADGNEKTRWMNCGSILKTNTGRVVLKLDALPLNPVTSAGDDGGLWLQCFEHDRDKGAPPARQGQARPPQQQQAAQGQGGYQNQQNPTYAEPTRATQQAPQQQAAPQPAAPVPNQGFADDDIPF
ncbi:MAG: hypothetical protein J7K90_09725 [Desulfuromusa sp.]|nr:hypothetical protein [Desulfuromusa sp.]